MGPELRLKTKCDHDLLLVPPLTLEQPAQGDKAGNVWKSLLQLTFADKLSCDAVFFLFF